METGPPPPPQLGDDGISYPQSTALNGAGPFPQSTNMMGVPMMPQSMDAQPAYSMAQYSGYPAPDNSRVLQWQAMSAMGQMGAMSAMGPVKAEPGTMTVPSVPAEGPAGPKPKRKYVRKKAVADPTVTADDEQQLKAELGGADPSLTQPPATGGRKRGGKAAAAGGGAPKAKAPKKEPAAPKAAKAPKKEAGADQPQITDQLPVKKKRDRFKGMPEEEVLKRILPDHIKPDLDILIVGINPGLCAAFNGHHYCGPGNHFWKCMFLSGLIPEPMNAYQDFKLLDFGIGFTNIVERTTRGSADLTRKEIQEGAKILSEKVLQYRPKIALFNGKGIYEVFAGHKKFNFGLQDTTFPGCDTTRVFVNPSSSARCTQLPRAVDKVPFYLALKKVRDWLRGQIPEPPISEIVFPSQLVTAPRKVKKEEVEGEGEAAGEAQPPPQAWGPGLDHNPATAPVGENCTAPVKSEPPTNPTPALDHSVSAVTKPPPRKRGRPSKKDKEAAAAANSNSDQNVPGAATERMDILNTNGQSGHLSMTPSGFPQDTVPNDSGDFDALNHGEFKGEIVDSVPVELRGINLPGYGPAKQMAAAGNENETGAFHSNIHGTLATSHQTFPPTTAPVNTLSSGFSLKTEPAAEGNIARAEGQVDSPAAGPTAKPKGPAPRKRAPRKMAVANSSAGLAPPTAAVSNGNGALGGSGVNVIPSGAMPCNDSFGISSVPSTNPNGVNTSYSGPSLATNGVNTASNSTPFSDAYLANLASSSVSCTIAPSHIPPSIVQPKAIPASMAAAAGLMNGFSAMGGSGCGGLANMVASLPNGGLMPGFGLAEGHSGAAMQLPVSSTAAGGDTKPQTTPAFSTGPSLGDNAGGGMTSGRLGESGLAGPMSMPHHMGFNQAIAAARVKAEQFDPAAALYGAMPGGMLGSMYGGAAAAAAAAGGMLGPQGVPYYMDPFWSTYVSQMAAAAAASGSNLPVVTSSSMGLPPSSNHTVPHTGPHASGAHNQEPITSTANRAVNRKPARGRVTTAHNVGASAVSPAVAETRPPIGGSSGIPRGGRLGSTASSPTQSSAQSSMTLDSLPRADSSMSVASWIVNSNIEEF